MLIGIVDSLTGLSADVAKEYVKQVVDGKETGKFILDVQGLEDASGLKSALGAERSENRKMAEAIKVLKDAGVTDFNKVVKDLKLLEELKGIDPKNEADKLAAAKVESLKEQMSKVHAEETGKLNKRAESLTAQVTRLLVTEEAVKAVAAAKGSTALLLPIIQGQARVRENADGEFVVEVFDSKGNPRIGSATGSPMTISQLVEELKGHADYGRAFEASQSGGGTPPAGGGAGAPKGTGVVNFNDQSGLNNNLEGLADGSVKVVA